MGTAVAAVMGCVMLHSQGGTAWGLHSPVGVTGIYLPGSGQTCYALSQEVMVWGAGVKHSFSMARLKVQKTGLRILPTSHR